MERKIWSQKEDNALKEIIQVRKIFKWSSISRTMQVDYDLPNRSGKQCRQRWHNQLDPKFHNENWTKQQQDTLFRLHNEIGNKWAKISTFLPGRTDNYIKNHFYSTFRKAVRRVNKFLFDLKHRQLRQIKNVLLNKILACAEDKFENKLNISKDVVQLCLDIKNRLVYFSNLTDLNCQEEKNLTDLVELIINFTKVYKKKRPKKKKKKTDSMIEVEQEERIITNRASSKKQNLQFFPNKQTNLFQSLTSQNNEISEMASSRQILESFKNQIGDLPQLIQSKIISFNNDITLNNLVSDSGCKLFGGESSRIFQGNQFQLQASASPNCKQNIFRMFLQKSSNIHKFPDF